jgi:hypothetical protein
MKTLLIAIAVFLLVTLTVAELELATAVEEFPYPLVSKISIVSPSNSTYNTTTLTLNVTANALPGYTRILMSYSIDGKQQDQIPVAETYDPHYGTITYANGTTKTAPSMFSRYLIQGFITLPNLTAGSHSLVVYAEYDYPNTKEFDYTTADRIVKRDQQIITYFDKSTVNFTINADSTIELNFSQGSQTDIAVNEDFEGTSSTGIPLGNSLTNNPAPQKSDNTSENNMSMVIAITFAVGVVAVALLAFKKTAVLKDYFGLC